MYRGGDRAVGSGDCRLLGVETAGKWEVREGNWRREMYVGKLVYGLNRWGQEIGLGYKVFGFCFGEPSHMPKRC